MKVELLQPDAAPFAQSRRADPAQFAKALDGVERVLTAATAAENRYADGVGSLQHAMYARARADVALAVATAAAQRGAQALNAIFNLQI